MEASERIPAASRLTGAKLFFLHPSFVLGVLLLALSLPSATASEPYWFTSQLTFRHEVLFRVSRWEWIIPIRSTLLTFFIFAAAFRVVKFGWLKASLRRDQWRHIASAGLLFLLSIDPAPDFWPEVLQGALSCLGLVLVIAPIFSWAKNWPIFGRAASLLPRGTYARVALICAICFILARVFATLFFKQKFEEASSFVYQGLFISLERWWPYGPEVKNYIAFLGPLAIWTPPLCVMVAIGALWQTAREFYAKSLVADLSVALALSSPLLWLIACEPTLYSPALAATSVLLWATARSIKKNSSVAQILGAICLALLTVVKPLTALAVSIPITVVALGHFVESKSKRLRIFVPALVLLTGFLVWAFFTLTLTGPLFPKNVVEEDPMYMTSTFQYQAKPAPRTFDVRFPLTAINCRLSLSPFLALALVAVLFLLGRRRNQDYFLLLLAAFALLALYLESPLPESGGPYQLVPLAPIFFMLMARAIESLEQLAAWRMRRDLPRAQLRGFILFVMIGVSLGSFLGKGIPLIRTLAANPFGMRPQKQIFPFEKIPKRVPSPSPVQTSQALTVKSE